MKTNQLMTVNLGKFGSVKIWHKTMMGKLEDVLEIGNSIREAKGLKPKRLDTYLRKKETWELILKVYNESLKSSSGIPEKVLRHLPKKSDESSWANAQKVFYQDLLDAIKKI